MIGYKNCCCCCCEKSTPGEKTAMAPKRDLQKIFVCAFFRCSYGRSFDKEVSIPRPKLRVPATSVSGQLPVCGRMIRLWLSSYSRWSHLVAHLHYPTRYSLQLMYLRDILFYSNKYDFYSFWKNHIFILKTPLICLICMHTSSIMRINRSFHFRAAA